MPTDLPDFDDCDDSGATEHAIEPGPLLADLDQPSTPAPAAAAR